MTMNETNQTLKFTAIELEAIVNSSGCAYTQSTIDIIECIISEYSHSIDAESPEDVIEALDQIENESNGDFTLDFDGNEYRIIPDSDIKGVYRDEIKQLIDDCYPEVKQAMNHSWISIEIDWETTIKNAMQDGYGHTFSSYDGSEHETSTHWIFRTN
jgi:hypothetical protein